MFTILTGASLAIAVGAWLYAFVHWVSAIRYRREDLSLFTMLFQGIKSFDPESFRPEGRRAQQKFMAGTAVFLLALLFTIVLAVVQRNGLR